MSTGFSTAGSPPTGRATRANPVKAGDAKLRGYRPLALGAGPCRSSHRPTSNPERTMSPTTRWSVPTIALAAAVVACAEPTAPTEDLDLPAEPIASSGAVPLASNGFPTGTTLYKFNLLGVPKGKTAPMT